MVQAHAFDGAVPGHANLQVSANAHTALLLILAHFTPSCYFVMLDPRNQPAMQNLHRF